MYGLGHDITDYIAACLRQIASVEAVLTWCQDHQRGLTGAPPAMSFRDHIARCNNYDPARIVPLFAAADRIGLVRRDNAEALRRFPEVFSVAGDKARLVAQGDADAVSLAVDRVVDALVAEKQIPKTRNETFDVAVRWGAPPLLRIDRGAVPFFGTRAYGVHLNGYRRERNELMLWVGRRSADKRVAPGKLDNLVAGGIGNGHGLVDTLVKEADEEAMIPPGLIARAVPAGAVSYRMETAARDPRRCVVRLRPRAAGRFPAAKP